MLEQRRALVGSVQPDDSGQVLCNFPPAPLPASVVMLGLTCPHTSRASWAQTCQLQRVQMYNDPPRMPVGSWHTLHTFATHSDPRGELQETGHAHVPWRRL